MSVTLPAVAPVASALVAKPSKPSMRHERVGAWTLTVVEDSFAGTMTCEIKTKAARYDHKAIIFQLPRSVDTFEAIYRIDNAPAVSWRSNAMTLAASGVALQSDDLYNPSQGRVAVPATLLSGAHVIAVRPSPQRPIRVFELDGLDRVLAEARATGCGPDFDPPGKALERP